MLGVLCWRRKELEIHRRNLVKSIPLWCSNRVRLQFSEVKVDWHAAQLS
jgi:hypothetical protein